MRIISSAFYIILFTTAAGAVFTVLSLFVSRTLRIALPLWAGVLAMALYVLPIPAPGLSLVSPREPDWVEGYRAACAIWACGVILLALHGLFKTAFARRAMGACAICGDGRINAICAQCARMAGLKRVPAVYFGTLDDPACVAWVLRPAILLREEAVAGLTEAQLTAVLAHEVMHIRRGHMLLGKIWGCVCILNWFNPLAWVARREFDVLCETDCDKNALAILEGRVGGREYALAMLRLLELSAGRVKTGGKGLGALSFLLAKRRIALVMKGQSRLGGFAAAVVLIVAAAAVIGFSVAASRGYFYPYPAYDRGVEYGADL